MKSLHLRAHIDAQGILTLTMPPEMAGQDVDLVVVFEPVAPADTPHHKLRPKDGHRAFLRRLLVAGKGSLSFESMKAIMNNESHWNDLSARHQRMDCRS
jgi:hypothetical protein